MFNNIDYLWDALIDMLIAEGLFGSYSSDEVVTFHDNQGNKYVAVKSDSNISISQLTSKSRAPTPKRPEF